MQPMLLVDDGSRNIFMMIIDILVEDIGPFATGYITSHVVYLRLRLSCTSRSGRFIYLWQSDFSSTVHINSDAFIKH